MRGRAAWIAAVGLLLGVPLAFLAGVLASEERLEGVTVEVSPVLIRVSVEKFTDERGVQAALSWEEGVALRAPPWSGIVTRVDVAPGDVLRTGDTVVEVDGITRLAAASPEPFYRPLRRDDRGPDVAALNRMLVRLGHLQELPGNPSTFDALTESAVEELERRIGVARPSGVFDPAWLVWIPEERFRLAEVDAEVGSTAPGPGAPVATGPPRLVKAQLQSTEGGPVNLDPSVPYRLLIGETRVRIDIGSLTVVPSDLPRLARAVPPLAEAASGSLRRARPLEAVAVPTAAVMSAVDGRLCVWVPDGARFSAEPVEAISSEGGVTRLLPGQSTVDQVLANPAEVLEDPSCPSS